MTPTRTDLTDASDADLAAAAAGGDEAAFATLYERHIDTAWRVAQAATARTEDAKDAAAEAFSRVYVALTSGSFDTTRPFRPYLLTAVRNAAIDAHRRGRRIDLTDDVEPDVSDRDRALPEERLDAGLEASLVVAAFDRLPERARTVLWLTEVEGLAPREAAEIIGVSANTTAQLAVRARARLRQEYLQAHLAATVEDACRWTVEHLGAYATGNLARTNIDRLEAHLSACATCTARFEELEDLRLNLRLAALPLLPLLRGELAQRWRAQLASHATAVPSPGQAAAKTLRSSLAVKAVAVAAAVVVLGGGVAWQVRSGDGGGATPAVAAAGESTATPSSTAAVPLATAPSTAAPAPAAGVPVGLQVLNPQRERAVYSHAPLAFAWWEADNLDSMGVDAWDFEKLTWNAWGSETATASGRYRVCGEGLEDPCDAGSIQLRLFDPREANCSGKPVRYYSRFGYTPTSDPEADRAVTIKEGQESVYNNPVDCPGTSRPNPVGQETGRVSFTHPRWGAVSLVTTLKRDPGDGHIYTIDQSGNIVWYFDFQNLLLELALNSPSRDRVGHIFVNHNAGRHSGHGVIVLRPTAEGYEDFESLPSGGVENPDGRFSEGTAVDHDGDGTLEIDVTRNNCGPACGDPEPTETYRWNGSDYVSA